MMRRQHQQQRQAAATEEPWRIACVKVKAFKSFPPTWSSFNIPPACHLVGVVGPNGCGKSNLLEAVCFAAGGSPGVLRLSGRSLKDLTSTDAGSERPEVRLSICQHKTTHTLEACLTADGTRAYRIDGRIKTGIQVKDFLRARGIVVDGTTVIQQASVTHLSDNNNAQALAQLVAAASRLNSWDHETAAARQEVSKTHKALRDIQGNVSKVQSSVAAEDAALKAAAEAAVLEQQLEQQVQELLAGLRQRQQQLEGQLQDAQAEERQLKESEAACAEQLQQLATQRRSLAAKQADELAQLDGSASTGSMAHRVAAAEAHAAALQAAITARAALLADLQGKQQLLLQQEAQCELLQQRATARQQEADSLASNLAAVKSSADAAAAVQQQAKETSMQAAAAGQAAQQQREALAARQQDVKRAQARLRPLQQQLQSLAPVGAQQPTPTTTAGAEAEAGCAVAAAAAARAAASAAADGNAQQLVALQQQLLKLQMQAEAAERQLTPPTTASLLAHLSAGSTAGSSSSKTAPLHSCFRLKDAAAAGLSPQQMEQLLTPLSVIAGPAVLQTLVAPSVQEANRVLAAAAAAAGGGGRGSSSSSATAASRRLKIWPLDNLSVHDTQQRQRAAQAQWGAQAVTLPLDLLQFEAAYRPALLRAFGGSVIAADDATAAAVVKQYGLPAVTLQGTVSRIGTMSGGWTGSSGTYSRACWGHKRRHDAADRQLLACQQRLAAARTQQQQMEQQRDAAEADLVAAQQRQQLLLEVLEGQAEVTAAAAAEQQAQQQVQELERSSTDLQARLRQYQAALGQVSPGAAGGGDGSGKSGPAGTAPAAAATLQQQLQTEASTAAQELEQAQDKVEELAACIEALECRIGSSGKEQQQQEQLQASLQALQQLQQQQEAGRAAADALQHDLRQLQQLDKQAGDAEQQQAQVRSQVAQAGAAVRAAAAAVQRLQKEHRQALKQFSDTEAAQTGLAPASTTAVPAAAAAAAAPTDVQLQQHSRRAKQLQAKLAKLNVPELLPGQKDALTARLAQVAAFNAQSDALREAAAELEAQMQADAEQVYAANDVVFGDIAAGFSQLCTSLLPSLELQLVRTGRQAHEGLQFRFRRLEDTTADAADAATMAPAAAGSSSDRTWRTNLGQLSGGQRTLVSLAMLLAVARTGSSCGLLLLDEVDAALDEVNQARTSALLKQLAHDGASACQILCVTHNSSFQESCDGFVRITKSAAGHSVPASLAESAPSGIKGSSSASKGGKRPGALSAAAAARKGAARGSSRTNRVGGGGGGSRLKRVRFEEAETEAAELEDVISE